jgi:uncharacterized protein
VSAIHPSRVAIREGLLAGSLMSLEQVHLAGTRCSTCQETSLGSREFCPNCGKQTVHEIALSKHGTLWSFTVVRHRPPGAFKGKEPFTPFGVGLVELPERLRVMTPVYCDIQQLRIGMELMMMPFVRSEPDGAEVVGFGFAPVSGDASV